MTTPEELRKVIKPPDGKPWVEKASLAELFELRDEYYDDFNAHFTKLQMNRLNELIEIELELEGRSK